MPNLVQLIEGDNLLLINMNNATSIRILFESVKKMKKFVLKEFLFSKESITKQDGKSFCNQFAVALFNEDRLKKATNDED